MSSIDTGAIQSLTQAHETKSLGEAMKNALVALENLGDALDGLLISIDELEQQQLRKTSQ